MLLRGSGKYHRGTARHHGSCIADVTNDHLAPASARLWRHTSGAGGARRLVLPQDRHTRRAAADDARVGVCVGDDGAWVQHAKEHSGGGLLRQHARIRCRVHAFVCPPADSVHNSKRTMVPEHETRVLPTLFSLVWMRHQHCAGGVHSQPDAADAAHPAAAARHGESCLDRPGVGGDGGGSSHCPDPGSGGGRYGCGCGCRRRFGGRLRRL
mmetsp:Transcript_1413/g.2144  ORF Transcript_1413/g.2144 Transcript_1413/m.2144 type:complete len:211 (-) Transcript_1413:104-736(-)